MTTTPVSKEPGKPDSPPSSGYVQPQKSGLLYDLNRESQTPYKIPGLSGGKLKGAVTERGGNDRLNRTPGS